MTSVVLFLVGVTCTCGAMLAAWAPSRVAGAGRRRAPTERGPEAGATVDAQAPRDAGRILEPSEIFAKLHCLALVAEELEPRVAPRHEEVAAAVAAVVASGVTESRYAMRRPMLLPQLVRAVNDNDTSRRELSGIIAKDPALVGSLLKLANSAWYRVGTHPVESIDRAVAILGTEGIRSLVAAAVIQPVFRMTTGAFASFPSIAWEHTFRSAAAAEAHAAFEEKTDRFAAQLLGLLMGLGAIVVFRIVLDRYAHAGLRPEPAAVAAALDAHAAATARRFAAGWELSERILEALDSEAHKRSTEELTPLGRSLRFGRLAGALAVLHANGLIDDASARASLHAQGTADVNVDRIWTRLSSTEAIDGAAAGA